jgi:hypothetical protein
MLLLALICYSFFNIGDFIVFTQKIIPNKYNILIKAIAYLDEKAVLNFAIMKRIFIFIIITIFYKKINNILPYFKIIYNAYFLSIVTFLFLSMSFYVANRTSWLFASVEPILLSSFIKIPNDNIIRFFILIGIVLYSLINIYSILKTQTDSFNLYLPYSLFFQ